MMKANSSLSLIAVVTVLLTSTDLVAQAAQRSTLPVADHHTHLQSRANIRFWHEQIPSVALPTGLGRVMRDFEGNWRSGDEEGLASLFTEDGIMQVGREWVRGRPAIRIGLLGKDGDLQLWAQAFETRESLGYIVGSYGVGSEGPTSDLGRFNMALHKGQDGNWRIAVAFLNDVKPLATEDTVPVTADRTVALLDSAGIQRAVVLSVAYQFGAPYKQVDDEYAKVRAENDWVAQEVARFPDRLVGFCSFNPLESYALDELQRCAREPRLSGLKLHFSNSDVDLRNPEHVERVRRIFRAANAARLPIVVHMRTLDRAYGRRDAQIFLSEILAEAPDIPVQVAHLAGWGGYDEGTDRALEVFVEAVASGDERVEHLYFDLASVVFLNMSDEVRARIAKRIQQLGVRRILFGIDGTPNARAWAAIRMSLPLEEADLRAIAENLAPYLR